MTQRKSPTYILNPADAFERYAEMVYRLAFVRTGNESDADDILSEVFLRLMKNSHKITNETHLKAWLLRVTVNCSNSLLTALHRRRCVAYEEAQCGVTSEENPVLPAVLALKPNQRTVVYMYYYEGYSVEEISEICSVPVGTVKSRLARAREELRRELKGDGPNV